jgi:hypothetical protein
LKNLKNNSIFSVLWSNKPLFSSFLISCYIIRTFVEHVCTIFVLC